MIRFVDLTDAYWCFLPHETAPPCCAFINTITDTFEHCEGNQIFIEMEEVEELGTRFTNLFPDGFFS